MPTLNPHKLYRVKNNPSISKDRRVNAWWTGKIVRLDCLVEDGDYPAIWNITEKDGKDLDMPEEYWAGISAFETDLEEVTVGQEAK